MVRRPSSAAGAQPDPTSAELVKARLRAVMEEFELVTYAALGAACGGASHSVVNNWLSRRNTANLPRVPEMTKLCEATGITLDWLYRGHAGSMEPKIVTSLNHKMRRYF